MVNRAQLDQAWVQLGRRLAALRRAARLSQTALGGLIGCVRSPVSHIKHAVAAVIALLDTRRPALRRQWRVACRV
jgi:transcriptional regulator with XRE-family HTH domain